MPIDTDTLHLLNKLVDYWHKTPEIEKYHLNHYARWIANSTELWFLDDYERPIVSVLRQSMSDSDWQRLPELLIALPQINGVVATLEHLFDHDFLAADNWFSEQVLPAGFLGHSEYDKLKAKFVQRWAKRVIDEELDLEQAIAVSSVTGNILVTARAGSGKTRTLVTRAIFFQKHCGVSPRELLLLAFNRAAAEEMKHRLRQMLGDDLPHVMTFHALAHALVKPSETMLFDDMEADHRGLGREIQIVVEEHIENPEYNNFIKRLMLARYEEDWQRVIDGRLLPREEFLDYRRGLPRSTLGGESVATFLEKRVANALFENDVSYLYRRSFVRNGTDYCPDFTVINPKTQKRIVLECFGDSGEDDYDDRTKEKRDFWLMQENTGCTLLEFCPADLRHGEESFVNELLRQVRQAGVMLRRLSEDEIWERVRSRAVDQFTEAIEIFVAHCRRRNLSFAELASMVQHHAVLPGYEQMFLDVAQSIYGRYLQVLVSHHKEDFSGLMWKAVEAVRASRTAFVRERGQERGDLSRLRFVLIDEFQDFSQLFYELLDSIRDVNPAAEFFCVGDDWQAINAFAGSELRFFQDFDRYFSHAVKREITTNYRSCPSIVEAGNVLMKGEGTPARSAGRQKDGDLWFGDLSDFQPTPIEDSLQRGIVPAVLRLVKHFLDEGQDVVLLSRKNAVDGFFDKQNSVRAFKDHIRSYLSPEDSDRVDASTVHKYKGREGKAVIVLDAFEGN